VSTRKALQARKGALQVLAEAFDHRVAPAFGLLALDDALAHVPVQLEQLAVDGEGCPDLGAADALLEVFQEGAVPLGQRHGRTARGDRKVVGRIRTYLAFAGHVTPTSCRAKFTFCSSGQRTSSVTAAFTELSGVWLHS